MEKLRRFSRQRQMVLDVVKNRTKHPTADKVYEILKKDHPEISLGTVYRNLNLLAEMGEISRVETSSVKDHFDGNQHPHAHFVCRKCGGVFDLNLDISQLLQSAKGVEGSFQVEDCKVLVQGVCEDCLKKEE
ncbi:Fur family transcriptional regulator [Merdimmobilis hominis]|jgi:Fur family peroxide stress response transcriptional regulator|uniref:Fur family transcriptional regulator n=1 Tax=Merdimmobilis hominis TaxID=2897707 RepID=UPI0006C778A4|nr:transcriptional repressor [Merdimmobilis hominis]PWL57902.1 MAG: transcriptional repressor [Oscillospiraceae bacterium]